MLEWRYGPGSMEALKNRLLMMMGGASAVALALIYASFSSLASDDALSQSAKEAVTNTGNRLGMILLVLAAGAVFLIFSSVNKLITSATRIGALAHRFEQGDSIPDDAIDSSLPLAEMERSLRKTLQASRKQTEGQHALIDNQKKVAHRLFESSQALAEVVRIQIDSVTETSATINESTASLREIADSVDTLAKSAEDSSSSVLEMVATSNEVADNIQSLSQAVEETTSSIEEMTYSIKEVAKNIEALSTTAEETASSMSQMDVSISQVENNATETTRLSETVMNDAEKGVQSINQTISGIDKIKEFSRTAAQVINDLGDKIQEIGNILNVIDDVAEQTNLLALNAAIIAAQAGEHGRGFAVVADEIKDLAERTGNSTKEIASLIKGVQDESKKAISVMEKGIDNVEEGVRLGHGAEDALRKILESANKSTLMVRAIATATLEQTKGSKQVTSAITRIAETVQQIALSTSEQANGSEQIMKSAERMKMITQHVERSAGEQQRGGKSVTTSIEKISQMAQQINRAQREQTKGNEQVLDAIERIREAAERNQRTFKDLDNMAADFTANLDSMRTGLSKK